jgi:hypothetical protein
LSAPFPYRIRNTSGRYSRKPIPLQTSATDAFEVPTTAELGANGTVQPQTIAADDVETPTVADDEATDAEVVCPTAEELPGLTEVEPTEAVESRTRPGGHPCMVPSASNFKTQTSHQPAPKDPVYPATT